MALVWTQQPHINWQLLVQSVTSIKPYTWFTKGRRAVLKIPSLSCLSSLLFTLHVWLCRGQKGRRSERISPQATHWHLGKSDFTSAGEADWRQNHKCISDISQYWRESIVTICSSLLIIVVKCMWQWKSILNWTLTPFRLLILHLCLLCGLTVFRSAPCYERLFFNSLYKQNISWVQYKPQAASLSAS